MTYKLQDSSEEMARISVTDTYGILPITNELLIALTYEGEDSDHVADALAQFELQAIDLSKSLGGDLTSPLNEAQKLLDQAKTERTEIKADILEQAHNFAEKAFSHLHELLKAHELNDDVHKQLHYLAISFATLAELGDYNLAPIKAMREELERLIIAVDDPNTLGTVTVTIGNKTQTRKENHEDILDYIEQTYYSLTDTE